MRQANLQPGSRFGRLVTVEDLGVIKSRRRWRCLCDCGTEIVTKENALKTGNTKSCGCLNRDMTAERNWKTGLGKLPEAQVWRDIRKRCLNPNDRNYKNYGARGITIEPAWLDLASFIKDVGLRPGPGYTLDRKDNSLGYQPGNVHWVTMKEQQRNKRSNRHVTINGVTKVAVDWADQYGIDRGTLSHRLNRVADLNLPTEVAVLDSRSFRCAIRRAKAQRKLQQ